MNGSRQRYPELLMILTLVACFCFLFPREYSNINHQWIDFRRNYGTMAFESPRSSCMFRSKTLGFLMFSMSHRLRWRVSWTTGVWEAGWICWWFQFMSRYHESFVTSNVLENIGEMRFVLFNCLYILFLCGHMWALPFFLPHENVTSKGNQVSFFRTLWPCLRVSQGWHYDF